MKAGDVMGWRERLFGKRSMGNPNAPITGAELLSITGGDPTKGGPPVNEITALRNVAVFACLRILSETPASLPLIVYKRLPDGGKERARNHPAYNVLHDMANPEMTAMSLRETIQGHAVSWGNGYAYILRENGFVKELWPLLPDKTRPERVKGELVYRVTLPTGEQRILNAYDVLHIVGFGYDGLQGYSPIRLARESIGLGLAVEEFGARFFGQGTNLGGIVEHPSKISPQAHQNLKQTLNQSYQGLNKSHLLMVLEEGMKYQRLGIAPNDSQFLETRKYQVTDIARLFRVPPHLIADLDRSTFNNIEHMGIDFVVHTLRPWLVRWEQALNYKIFTPRERKEFFVEHLVDGLLRGDSKSRAEALATLRQNGIINADEWREIENMNPQEGGTGKVYLVNGNMLPISVAGAKKAQGQSTERNLPVAEKRDFSHADRYRLMKVFQPLFHEAGTRIVRREKADIARAAAKMVDEQNMVPFNNWLETFYQESHEWITRIMHPLAMSYAEAVQMAATKEIGVQAEMTKDTRTFVGQYVDSFVHRYAGSSIGQIRNVVEVALRDKADIAASINTRLDEWEQRRPEKVAVNETVQAANAVAMVVFAEHGIRRLTWHNTDAEACYYCKTLHGRTVTLGLPFVHDAETIGTPDGNMHIFRDTKHPPLHQKCSCIILPN